MLAALVHDQSQSPTRTSREGGETSGQHVPGLLERSRAPSIVQIADADHSDSIAASARLQHPPRHSRRSAAAAAASSFTQVRGPAQRTSSVSDKTNWSALEVVPVDASEDTNAHDSDDSDAGVWAGAQLPLDQSTPADQPAVARDWHSHRQNHPDKKPAEARGVVEAALAVEQRQAKPSTELTAEAKKNVHDLREQTARRIAAKIIFDRKAAQKRASSARIGRETSQAGPTSPTAGQPHAAVVRPQLGIDHTQPKAAVKRSSAPCLGPLPERDTGAASSTASAGGALSDAPLPVQERRHLVDASGDSAATRAEVGAEAQASSRVALPYEPGG